jgi:hypothetical protein
MIRNPSLESAIVRAIASEPLISTNGICRRLGGAGQARSNAQSVRRCLKVLRYEQRIVNVGDTVAAWKVAK